jgi:mono/diheme cytochrome c family protein
VIAVIGIGIWLSTTNTASTTAAAGDMVSGEALFKANCAQCHGIEATGTESGPPLVHQYYVPSHHADAAFLLAVRNGVRPHHWNFGAMPAIRGLSDDDVANIVAHVRSLQRSAGLIADNS